MQNKVKASTLTGPALDWAVTQCEGTDHLFDSHDVGRLHYSTDWSQGGPIIDREDIAIGHGNSKEHPDYRFSASKIGVQPWAITAEGPTKLIAAMRCYVASKLGDEVEVPEELLA